MVRYRGRWRPSFVDDYAKLRSRVNREYGEREYDDKFRVERSPGMLRQPDVDYVLEAKPYYNENVRREETPLSINNKGQRENALDRIEALEREKILNEMYEKAVPMEVQKEQSLPKVQYDESVERSDNVEPVQAQVNERVEYKLQPVEQSSHANVVKTNVVDNLEVNPMERDLLDIESRMIKKPDEPIQTLERKPKTELESYW